MKLLIDGTVLSMPEVRRGIGKVFISLVNAIVHRAPFEEYILVYFNDADLEYLDPWVLSLFECVKIDKPTSSPANVEGANEYTGLMQDIVDAHDVDIYWNPNPLMVNSYNPVGLERTKVAATLFDVIPYILKSAYLDQWPKEMSLGYVHKLKGMKKNSDLILGISHDASETYKNIKIKGKGNRVVDAPISCNEEIFWPSKFEKTNQSNPKKYILLVGGDDPRKNMDLAISGFAEFLQGSPEAEYDLIITSRLSDKTCKRLYELAERLGIRENLVLTGYISDHHLAELYREAQFSLFPSRYEGFGLPILESLRCGTYVCSSNIPTSVEIGTDFITYFDDFNAQSVAQAIIRTCDFIANQENLYEKCLIQASDFNWKKTAEIYLSEFNKLCKAPQASLDKKHPKIAMLTPWPNQPSGIADYSYDAAVEMTKHCKLHVFYPSSDEKMTMKPLKGVVVKSFDALKRSRTKFDGYIVHLGNNTEYHKELYEWVINAPILPPLIVLHDVNIHPFMQHGFLFADQAEVFFEALSAEVSAEEFETLQADIKVNKFPRIWDYPLSAHLLKFGPVLLHNQSSRKILNKARGNLSEHDVYVAPLASPKAETPEEPALKDVIDICVVGYINKNKRPEICLTAFAELLKLDLPLRLTFVGKLNDESIDLVKMKESLLPPIHQDKVVMTGFVSSEVYTQLTQRADIIWNLRYPSMGESSATLHGALGQGKAVIVSNYEQFKEYPDDVVWKVDVGPDEVDQLVSLTKHLIINADTRVALGKNAQDWALDVLSFENVAKTYVSLSIGTML